ncbi:flavin monoamine oxidase family protein [Variovorax sp. KBW07]|uniref:flavin monoamine oxidase family protein n=1 Tax=Variovorax sp. KBW07 TaxID=2153358 RepID=UPI001C8AF5E2|nr:flavin monoamine oxidase family protein [Variovorax sp. KBW07]
MTTKNNTLFSRRDLLALIGKTAGGGAMYQAMTSLGFAAESNYNGPPKLDGAKRGASVLVLGAGLAGMAAALELRNAGYSVKVLEFSQRAGGRCWTLRGGDTFTELGGAVQQCGFAKGEYFNPGPWRIPYHHHAALGYCKRLGVALEPFVQVNYNALVHSSKAYGGKPQKYRHVQADYQGYVAELLGKATSQGNLDAALTKEDKEKLLEGLRRWGALDTQFRYREGTVSSDRRGYDVDAGGGLMPLAKPSKPLDMSELLQSNLWRYIASGQDYEFQSAIFQPVGGMDMIAKAFQKEVGSLIRYGAKVTKIEQNDRGVTVTYTDASKGGAVAQAKADWCLCTIPLSVLSQIDIQVGAPMQEAINAVPYGASVKVGLQFKRRFWEEDEHIYGGISYTDLPISRISYPSTRYGTKGKSVVLGAYVFDGPNSYEFTAMAPEERVRRAVEFGSQLHPQYASEFDNGISVGWHRVPGSHGCYGMWTEDTRQKHYRNLCQVDGRIALAGEHASYIPAWQEGALLSSLDAIQRLHARAVAA